MNRLSSLALAGVLALSTLLPRPVQAVEGGIGAYLLGSRDTFAGIVPGPGNYLAFDFITLQGQTNGLSLGGLPIRAESKLDLNLIKLSYTHVLEGQIWGGTPAVNVNVPLLDAELSFVGVTPPLVGQSVRDTTSGVGDIVITPMLGWHSGKLHYSAGLSIFAPTGDYSTATLNLAERSIDALSNGKNVWSLQPVLALTHFNPENGWEFSGAASLLFSTRNSATDYKTGTALNLEGAVLKHARSGFAYGLAGYAYQQLESDSGQGAENLENFLGASDLKARVYGLGPIIAFDAQIGKLPVRFKLKYTHEFDAKQRFESDHLWLNAAITF